MDRRECARGAPRPGRQVLGGHPGVADAEGHHVRGDAEVVGHEERDGRPDALTHLVPVDLDVDPAVGARTQVGGRRGGDGSVAADRGPPADLRPVVGAHGARLGVPPRPTEPVGAATQALGHVAGGEGLAGHGVGAGVVGQPQRDRVLARGAG